MALKAKISFFRNYEYRFSGFDITNTGNESFYLTGKMNSSSNEKEIKPNDVERFATAGNYSIGCLKDKSGREGRLFFVAFFLSEYETDASVMVNTVNGFESFITDTTKSYTYEFSLEPSKFSCIKTSAKLGGHVS